MPQNTFLNARILQQHELRDNTFLPYTSHPKVCLPRLHAPSSTAAVGANGCVQELHGGIATLFGIDGNQQHLQTAEAVEAGLSRLMHAQRCLTETNHRLLSPCAVPTRARPALTMR